MNMHTALSSTDCFHSVILTVPLGSMGEVSCKLPILHCGLLLLCMVWFLLQLCVFKLMMKSALITIHFQCIKTDFIPPANTIHIQYVMEKTQQLHNNAE